MVCYDGIGEGRSGFKAEGLRHYCFGLHPPNGSKHTSMPVAHHWEESYHSTQKRSKSEQKRFPIERAPGVDLCFLFCLMMMENLQMQQTGSQTGHKMQQACETMKNQTPRP